MSAGGLAHSKCDECGTEQLLYAHEPAGGGRLRWLCAGCRDRAITGSRAGSSRRQQLDRAALEILAGLRRTRKAALKIGAGLRRRRAEATARRDETRPG